jgi:hypothetical protein
MHVWPLAQLIIESEKAKETIVKEGD